MTDTDRLAALMDPENAPAVHGEWRPAHRPMGEESVILDDDDGCSLFVEPWEVAELVNRAIHHGGPALIRAPAARSRKGDRGREQARRDAEALNVVLGRVLSLPEMVGEPNAGGRSLVRRTEVVEALDAALAAARVHDDEPDCGVTGCPLAEGHRGPHVDPPALANR